MPTIQHPPLSKTAFLICLVGLLPFVVLGFLRHLGLFEFIELKTLDRRLQLMLRSASQVSDRLILIPVDDRTETALGSQLSWQPDIYASLLYALQTADPTAVGLIINFNREWGDEKRLPGERLFVTQLYSIAEPPTRDALPEAMPWSRLPDSLTGAKSSFSWFPFSHADGIRRSAQLVAKSGASHQYSLEMLMLCQVFRLSRSGAYGVEPASIKIRDGFWRGKFLEFHADSGETIRIPVDSHGRLFMRFVEDTTAFQSLPFVDTLEAYDATPAEFRQRFNGKIVLIGITRTGVPQASTPIGEMSALVLRANLLNALLNRDFIWSLSRKANLLYLVCLAIFSTIAAIAVHRRGHGARAILLIAVGLLGLHLLFVSIMFVQFNVWMELTASSLALISAGVINSLFLSHLRLRDLFRQLQQTQNQLVQSEKEAVFGIMAARVRHELRNVLNLIRAPAEMIRNNFRQKDPLNLREQPEEIIHEMDAIIGWVTKLDEMVENELSFFQNTRLTLQMQPLEPIIRSALEMMQPEINTDKIQVKLNLPTNIPPLALDADKIRIVFANLIKNACQAMPNGGRLEIAIAPATAAKGVLITVKDTGRGIPEDERGRIFEPFHTTKPRGLGLGLVNVKNIVEGHGGRVFVESEVGVGTTFFIELPIGDGKMG